ncbi:MAG: D-alanine--D-alanine ligase [Enterobacteriaceae bacterium]
MKKKIISMFFGGESKEYKISLNSLTDIIKVINYKKYTLILIEISKKGEFIFHNKINYLKNNFLENSKKNKFSRKRFMKNIIYFMKTDIIFPIIHGNNGESGEIQGISKLLKIPCVGSSLLSSSICFNKDITKIILKNFGILVSPFLIFNKKDNKKKILEYSIKKLGFPLIIKPNNQGSSIGVNKAIKKKELKFSINQAFKYSNKILIEKFIDGKEIEVAILGNEKIKVSLCGEIKRDNFIFSYKRKYIKKKRYIIIPAKIKKKINKKIKFLSKKIYKILECKSMARISFFIKKNKIIFNEINTIPGLYKTSIYSSLWKYSGLKYKNLINKIINLSIKNEK